MSEATLLANSTVEGPIDLQAIELHQNYSVLINQLEQLALGLDSALGNLTFDRKDFEISIGGSPGASSATTATVGGNGGLLVTDFIPKELFDGAAAAIASTQHAAATTHTNQMHELETGLTDVAYSRVVSDIWIGIILTLLIVSVIFFICSCFLYHKFQQWKNSYRTAASDNIEVCRRYATEYEAESLPSYTIVSGLPSYDDALEEFRKAGIVLTPHIPIIKIFEKDAKDSVVLNVDSGEVADLAVGLDAAAAAANNTAACICGAAQIPATSATPINSSSNAGLPSYASLSPQVIELSPEQLEVLSKKRLSLQIAFNQSFVRRVSRPRCDLYREVLRSTAAASSANNSNSLPPIHRSSSTNTLTQELDRRLHYLHHHRGSLC